LLELLHDTRRDALFAQTPTTLARRGLQGLGDVLGFENLFPVQTATSTTHWYVDDGFSFEHAVRRHGRDIGGHRDVAAAVAGQVASVLKYFDLNRRDGRDVGLLGVGCLVVSELVARLAA